MRFVPIPCLVLLAGCASGDPSYAAPAGPRASLGREFSIALGESIPLEGTPYSLTFRRVLEDSRCAQGVTCVWEGNARLEIELLAFEHRPPGFEAGSVSVELNTSSRIPTKDPGSGIIMEIRRLEPIPRSDAPTLGYVVTLFARKP
jgi:hypothetical protein